MMIPDALAALGPSAILVAVASALGGLSRGFSGFGGALIFVPFASAIVGPTVAVPIFLVCDTIISSPLIATALRRADWSDVRPLVGGALVGLPIGNWALVHAEPDVIRWAICVSIMACLVVLASGWRLKGCPGWRTRVSVGATSGLLSGMASIGGPPAVVYWLSTTTDIVRMRHNLMAYFACITAVAICLFAWRGLLTEQVFWLVALCAPGYGFGIWLGNRLFPLASVTTYRRIAYALVALSALSSLPVLDWLMGRG